LQLQVPYGNANFMAYTTAVDLTAPPILQWDSETARNPVAWYVYNGGSAAASWGLEAGFLVDVLGIASQPDHFPCSPPSHRKDSSLLILRGCVDSVNRSLGLFPECMRSELHSVRSVIEAHSRSRSLEGADAGQLASGLRVDDGGESSFVLVCGIEGGASVRYRVRA
jgi:hypothetical protein